MELPSGSLTLEDLTLADGVAKGGDSGGGGGGLGAGGAAFNQGTALAAEDRCHLNGLAMAPAPPQKNQSGVEAPHSKVPRFVTALGATDTANGWRQDKAKGGCLMDVSSGEFVAHGGFIFECG